MIRKIQFKQENKKRGAMAHPFNLLLIYQRKILRMKRGKKKKQQQ